MCNVHIVHTAQGNGNEEKNDLLPYAVVWAFPDRSVLSEAKCLCSRFSVLLNINKVEKVQILIVYFICENVYCFDFYVGRRKTVES